MPESLVPLSHHQIEDFLSGDLKGWDLKNGGFHKKYAFKNFSQAFAFFCRIALLCEKYNHHPDLSLSYNQVIISGLKTHDCNNQITFKDIDLASEITKLVSEE